MEFSILFEHSFLLIFSTASNSGVATSTLPNSEIRPLKTDKSLDSFVPFRSRFLLNQNISAKNRFALEKAFRLSNARLSQMLRGPKMNDYRFERDICTETRTCAGISIPDEHMMPCDTESKVQTNADILGENKENFFTLVVYIAIKDETDQLPCNLDFKHKTVIANGAACDLDPETGRRIRGRIYFCEKQPHEFNSSRVLETVLTHELVHIILHSLDGSRDERYCEEHDKCEGITWRRIDRKWTDKYGSYETKPIFMATLQGVHEEAKNLFACDSIEGAELNRKFVNGTWKRDLWHWSPRIFPYELMAPGYSVAARITRLTLAAIKESQWYEVNMSAAEPMVSRPISQGCAVARNSCHDVIKSAKKYRDGPESHIAPYCIQGQGPRCSTDGTVTMSCDIFADGCMQLHPITLCGEESAEGSRNREPNVAKMMCLTVTDMIGHDLGMIDPALPFPQAACVPSKCLPESRIIEFELHSQNSSNVCRIRCIEDDAYKIVTHYFEDECQSIVGHKIEYFCPSFPDFCGVKFSKSHAATPVQMEIPASTKGESNRCVMPAIVLLSFLEIWATA